MKAQTSEKGRHVVFRASAGEKLPDALVRALEDEAVACGWIRASGVLEAVELRALRSDGSPASRRLDGRVHVVSLEGSIGLAGGALSVGMRAIVARETDRGLETLAGEIVSARVVGLEAIVTALDDVAIPRGLDAGAGVWLLGEAGATEARAAPKVDAQRADAPKAEWSEAVAASAEPPKRPAPAIAPIGAAIPQRPVRPEQPEAPDAVVPEEGAVVDHFAFGRCDVIKSDGDRLHLRMHRDGRVKEIALEMLKATPLPDEDGKKRFKLERRL